jgi:hypothetical protein
MSEDILARIGRESGGRVVDRSSFSELVTRCLLALRKGPRSEVPRVARKLLLTYRLAAVLPKAEGESNTYVDRSFGRDAALIYRSDPSLAETLYLPSKDDPEDMQKFKSEDPKLLMYILNAITTFIRRLLYEKDESAQGEVAQFGRLSVAGISRNSVPIPDLGHLDRKSRS